MTSDTGTPLTEIWVWEGGTRYRVYRGRDPEHISWKLDHHRRHSPEIMEIEEQPVDHHGPEAKD